MTDTPVTLLFVAWNARAHLPAALDAARETGWPVVVVDNASTDGTADIARARAGVRVVASDRNLGFAGGVNAGLAATDTPWVLVLNPDILVTRDAIARLLADATADDDIALAGAQLVGTDGRPQPEYSIRRFPTLATWAVDLLLIDHVWPTNPASARYLATDLDRDRDQDVDQPAAACLLVRRAAFDAVGGLDTTFHPAWFEDVDFCRRIAVAGWRIRYVASARVVHEGGVAMRAIGLGSFSSIWYRNLLRYVAKHGGFATRLLIRPLLIAGLALRITLSLLRGRPAEARAYAAALPVALRRVDSHARECVSSRY